MNLLKESCYEQKKHMRIPTETAKQLYYYVQWAGRFVCRQEFHIKRSHFTSFLLMYTTEGSGTLHYGGKQYDISQNTVCFLDCRLPHEYFTHTAPWNFKFIHFYGNLSKSYYDYILQLYKAPVFPCGVTDMEAIFDRIIENVQNAGEEAICSEYVYRILTELIRSFRHTDDSFDAKAVMNHMAENYMACVSVEDIARSFHMSRSYFTTKFKEATGISPYAYLKRCRISAAKGLLANTNHTVQAISEYCGFNSCSAFIRSFRSATGTTPLLYRKRS